MVAHSYYMDAPEAKLDQEQTRLAIEYYTKFTENYPESQYAQQAYDEMTEMYDRLAEKEPISAITTSLRRLWLKTLLRSIRQTSIWRSLTGLFSNLNTSR